MSSSETLTLIRGDDYQIPMHFTNADGTNYDLTGHTVFFTVKDSYVLDTANDDDAVITKEITSHSDPVNGITILELTNTDTNIGARTYSYDLQIKTAGGKIHSSIKGDLTVSQDVTKRTA